MPYCPANAAVYEFENGQQQLQDGNVIETAVKTELKPTQHAVASLKSYRFP